MIDSVACTIGYLDEIILGYLTASSVLGVLSKDVDFFKGVNNNLDIFIEKIKLIHNSINKMSSGHTTLPLPQGR